jgi:hypothetical protein
VLLLLRFHDHYDTVYDTLLFVRTDHSWPRTEREPRRPSVLEETADQERSVREALGVNALVSDFNADADG